MKRNGEKKSGFKKNVKRIDEEKWRKTSGFNGECEEK